MSYRDNLPSVWLYGLALIIVIAGFAVFAWYLSSGISSAFDGIEQMTAPGEAEVHLDEPGEYTIFYENRTYFKDRFYITPESIPGLQVVVLEKATGRILESYPPSSDSSYALGGRSGRSFMAFRAEEAGVYLINASYPQTPGPEVVLAIGKGVMEELIYKIAIAIAIIAGSLLIAAFITYTTYTRRKKAYLLEGGETGKDSAT